LTSCTRRDVGQPGRPAVHVLTWRRPRPLTAAGRRRHARRLTNRQTAACGQVATWGSILQAPGHAWSDSTAQYSTVQHTSTRGRRRPAELVHDRRPAGQAPGQGLELVHVENPAGTLDRLGAHNSRHHRRHTKRKTGRHARGICTRPRPTAADCHHPPGEPPTPLTGVYPHWWG
jgi:hypothetical protein